MEEIQKKLTDKLLSTNLNRYPVSLFHGKMGLSIYFYQLSKIGSNPEYHSKAEQLLDQILMNDLSINQSIDVEDGLAGIGLGVTWLVKNGFIEGDLNEMLEVIDDAIYRRIVFQPSPSHLPSTILLHLTGYLYIRLKEQTDDHLQIIYQDLIIKILNVLYNQIDDDFMNESYTFSVYHYNLPVFLWILSKLLESGFYNDRIYRILHTLQINILSRFPVLHANRLFLLWGILHLLPFMQNNSSWINYVQLLYREINLQEILENELKDRTIFASNGLSMIYILLHAINKSFPECQIPFNPQTIDTQIQKSDAWNALIERDYFYKIHQGLVNGFPGVQLVLSHIRQNYLSNEQNANEI